MLAYLAFFPKRALSAGFFFSISVFGHGFGSELLWRGDEDGGSRIQNPSELCGLPVSTCSTRFTESECESDSLSLARESPSPSPSR